MWHVCYFCLAKNKHKTQTYIHFSSKSVIILMMQLLSEDVSWSRKWQMSVLKEGRADSCHCSLFSTISSIILFFWTQIPVFWPVDVTDWGLPFGGLAFWQLTAYTSSHWYCDYIFQKCSFVVLDANSILARRKHLKNLALPLYDFAY